jgi:hypothetical protein
MRPGNGECLVGKTEGVEVEGQVAAALEMAPPGERASFAEKGDHERWRRLVRCGMRRDPSWSYQLTGCQQSGWTETQQEWRKWSRPRHGSRRRSASARCCTSSGRRRDAFPLRRLSHDRRVKGCPSRDSSRRWWAATIVAANTGSEVRCWILGGWQNRLVGTSAARLPPRSCVDEQRWRRRLSRRQSWGAHHVGRCW